MAFKHARNCGKCGRYINGCWCSFYPEKGYHDEGLCDECFEADTREMWAKPPVEKDRAWRPTYTSPVNAVVPTNLTETERNELMRLRSLCDQLTDLMTGWKHRAERAESDLGEARSYANNLVAQQDSIAAERRRVEISLIQARETIRCEAKMRQAAEDQVAELFDKFRLIQGRELFEQLAQYAHEAWAGWTTWMIDKWDKVCEDSGETYQARWIRQIGTLYKELPERDKLSDRDEAMKITDIVARHLGLLQGTGKPDA